MTVERWGIFELAAGPNATAQFRCGDHYGFAAATGDGIRFMPDAVGRWHYRVNDVARTAGSFECVPAGQGNHGPVRVRGVDRLEYADGTRYRPLTTTCEQLTDDAVKALADSPFNRVRTSVTADIEARVAELQRAGIEVELLLAGLDISFVSRMAAYRNVWWSLPPRPESVEDARLIAEYDYGHHPLTVHAEPRGFDFGIPALTHLSLSMDNMRSVSRLREDYRKPIFVDYCGCEGDAPRPDHSLPAAEMVRRVWEGTIRGGHVGHGECYEQAGWLSGEAVPRLAFLRDIFAELPADAAPANDYYDGPMLAIAGQHYLQYLGEHQFPERRFRLPDGRYSVDLIDTWAMTIATLPDPVEGEARVDLPGTQFQAVRLRRLP